MTTAASVAGTFPTGKAGVAREWDGHAWVGQIKAEPQAEALPGWHRRPFAVFGHRLFWLWVGCWLVGIALALGYTRTGNMIFLIFAGIVAPAGTLIALARFLWRRLRLSEAISGRAAIWWGLASGILAIGWALVIEMLLWPWIIGHGAAGGWEGVAIAGPAESSGKLLIPLVLYIFGRYRDPRAGIALALFSGLVFGWCEGFGYIATAASSATDSGGEHIRHVIEHAQTPPATQALPSASQLSAVWVQVITRPVVELMHPILTGFVAAVAWRAGWVRHRFWPALIIAWIIAAIVHSANDVSLDLASQWTATAGIALIIQASEYFVLLRPAARELTPPSALAANPPRWRPHIPPRGQTLPAATQTAAT